MKPSTGAPIAGIAVLVSMSVSGAVLPAAFCAGERVVPGIEAARDNGSGDAVWPDSGLPDAGGDTGPADGGADARRTYRAIAGFSMGGLSAAMLGLKHEDLFDVTAPLGTFLDGTGFLRFFSEGILGGFCVPPELGKMCPSPGAGEDYEHMDLGGENSGTTHRWSFVKVAQDTAAIAGNPFLYNPASPPAAWHRPRLS